MENNPKEIKLVRKEDKNFPSSLKKISSPPKTLYFQGKFDPEGKKIIAIVGTRKPSREGEKIAYQLAFELAQRKIIVLSGLAFGIDCIAHQAALEAGGITWAVLASGLDKVYPASHKNLAQKIIEKGGCLISEYPSGAFPQTHYFVLRNRLISALAEGVLVVEAPLKSGALITAHFAFQQKKKLMAVPGSPFSPNSQGTNQLIKEGAILVRNADDVLEELRIKTDTQQKVDLDSLNSKERKIIEVLREKKELDVDNLCQLTKLNSQELLSELSKLIIEGKVKENNRGRYTLSF